MKCYICVYRCGRIGRGKIKGEIVRHIDNYDAKFELWAKDQRVYPIPRIANLPHFGCKRFNSYEELAEWKRSLLDKLAEAGGAKWTK